MAVPGSFKVLGQPRACPVRHQANHGYMPSRVPVLLSFGTFESIIFYNETQKFQDLLVPKLAHTTGSIILLIRIITKNIT